MQYPCFLLKHIKHQLPQVYKIRYRAKRGIKCFEVIPCTTKTLILNAYRTQVYLMHVGGSRIWTLVICRAHALALSNLPSAAALNYEGQSFQNFQILKRI